MDDKQKKGRPSNNKAQNKQFRDVSREITIGEDRNLQELFKRCIEYCSRNLRMNLGYNDLKRIAKLIKSERRCDCNGE